MKYRYFILTLIFIGIAAFTPVSPASGIEGSLRQITTTGSISANSNQLTVASVAGFQLGDWVIVEIGKEPGQGMRGTRGVGGTWPAKSYATEAQMYADKTLPNKTFVWAEDTGYVFWWIDLDTNPNTPPIWYSMAREKPNHFYTGYYYFGKVIPRSLQGKITAINGNTLTLDKSAAVSVSGANVYLDTTPIITNLINRNTAFTLPEGNFPTGGVVWIKNKQGFTLAGQGKDKTRIYSPKGVPGASIEAYQSPNTTVHSLTLESNWGDHGFGLNWVGSTEPGSFKPVTETDTPQGAAFPVGIYFNYGSSNSEARDARIINVAQVAAGTSFTTNVWGRRLENIQTNAPRDYIQWQYKWADTDKGGCEDCEIRSTYIIPGFSGFKASNIQFIRPKGTNAVVAMNDVGGFLVEDANLRFTANSLHPQSDPIAMSALGSPIININTNIGSNFAAPGGTIRDATIIQEGYVNGNDDTLRGIVVNENNPNIRIEGGWYQAPDYKSGSATGGAVGLDSTGPGTYVDGLKVLGKSSNAGPNLNIFMQKAGTLTNCVAETSWPPNACQTPAQAGLTPITGTTPLPTPTPIPLPTPIPTPAPSPNGTRGTTVIDSDGVTWSIDANKNLLRNGVPFNGGWADQLLWWNGIVYHHGVGTKEWYTWNGVTWISHGLTDPQLGTAYKFGDINNDGQITAFDAALAAQASVGLITLTGYQTKAADVNGSLDVTAFDAALIVQYSVGLITKFPAG